MCEFSIIIPIYNAQEYLKNCLSSVFNQTFSDFEVICVNDGSEDASLDILQKFANKRNNIKIISQENQGASSARNRGKNEAIGKYIYFLDADDYMHPKLLEITHKFAENHNADMVCFDFIKSNDMKLENFINKEIENINKIKYVVSDNPLQYTKKRCKYNINFASWTKVYKSNFISNLSYANIPYFEDALHTFEAIAKKPKTVILAEKLYYYVDNPNSLSKFIAKPKHIQGYHKGLDVIYETYRTHPLDEYNFIIKEVFSNVLKQELNLILRAPKENQPELWQEFIKELQDLDKKGCIKLRGNKISRYLKYKKLIKGKF